MYFLFILFVGKDCQEKSNKVSEERRQGWISEKESQERREGCKSRERGEHLPFCLLHTAHFRSNEFLLLWLGGFYRRRERKRKRKRKKFGNGLFTMLAFFALLLTDIIKSLVVNMKFYSLRTRVYWYSFLNCVLLKLLQNCTLFCI